MDLFWIKHGFIGRNICFIPNGESISDRFNEASPYYESWIGSYFIYDLKRREFATKEDAAIFFSNAALADQDAWLRTYGIENPQTKFLTSSLLHVKSKHIGEFEQDIFYGEITTANDDFVDHRSSFISKNFPKKYIRMATEEYNQTEIPKNFFASDYSNRQSKVKLFGFYSIVRMSKRKYIVTYACTGIEHKAETYGELLKVVEDIQIQASK